MQWQIALFGYVDGFNLYFGLKDSKWERYLWLDVCKMVERLLLPTQTLIHTKYFTARISSPDDKRKRQLAFLEALETNGSALSIHYGHYLQRTVRCRKCSHSYTTHDEKMTDVNIAVELLTDAFQDKFDTALLISADSDLRAPICAIRALFPAKRVVVFFPPKRFSNELTKVAHAHFTIGRGVISSSQFPNTIASASGFPLSRPTAWR